MTKKAPAPPPSKSLGRNGRATLNRLLRAAQLPVPRTAEAALTEWATWVVTQNGRATPARVASARESWRRRLSDDSPSTNSPAARSVALARQQNLLALSLGIGGPTALARQAGRAHSYYSRIITGARNMGGRAARRLEAALALDLGWLDVMDRALQEGVQTGAHLADAGSHQGKDAAGVGEGVRTSPRRTAERKEGKPSQPSKPVSRKENPSAGRKTPQKGDLSKMNPVNSRQ